MNALLVELHHKPSAVGQRYVQVRLVDVVVQEVTLGGLDHYRAWMVLGPLEGRWHHKGWYLEVAVEQVGAASRALPGQAERTKHLLFTVFKTDDVGRVIGALSAWGCCGDRTGHDDDDDDSLFKLAHFCPNNILSRQSPLLFHPTGS